MEEKIKEKVDCLIYQFKNTELAIKSVDLVISALEDYFSSNDEDHEYSLSRIVEVDFWIKVSNVLKRYK